MSSECTLRIPASQNIHFIHNRLKEHIIIYNPPYSIANILTPYMSPVGREIKVVIEHASRNVHIIEGSIRSHVLQTTILAFQQHRLHSPFLTRQEPMEPMEPMEPLRQRQRLSTGKECPICYDIIYQYDMTALPCAHLFHQPCIQPWLNRNPTCPVCRNHV